MSPKYLAVIVVGFSLISFAGAQEKPIPKYATEKVARNVKTQQMADVVAVPANCAAQNANQLGIMADGTVVVTRSDGSQETHSPANLALPRRPPAPGETCDKCDQAVSNTLPALPEVNKWLRNHAQVLLNTIESIAGPDGANNELQWERGNDIYGVVAKRTETVRQLALYFKNQ